MRRLASVIPLLLLFLAAPPLRGQETPYFVTYSHHLEESGDMEVRWNNTIGIQRNGAPAFWAPFGEIEYGVTDWWTSEFYLEGQKHSDDGAIFTGWRLENRFRVLPGEHRINPVLYFEYENVNEGSRTMQDVVGRAEPLDEPNSTLQREHAHELETKLILSSDVGRWNLSENFIVEKNLTEDEGFEFGYAFGASHPLSTRPAAAGCRFCGRNFQIGAEAFGGLGSTQGFGLRDTAHYLAPVLSWRLGESTIGISPAIGLTRASSPLLLRISFAYEMEGFRNRVASMFRRR